MKTPRLPRRLVLALMLTGLFARGAEMPLFDNLGSYSRTITTDSPQAQKYFDQGLRFLYGFNHGAAIRSFQAAAAADPACAMAHWGVALACGPHINFPMVPPPMAELAWKELALAKANAAHASAAERELIEALAARYANPQPEDRGPLDRAYADAMREFWRAHPKDADAGALFAEAMMDLRPWDQWTPAGQPEPGTNEILATLDAVLKLDVNHPFANHLYIHAIEASPHPERAIAAADRLRDLQPGLAHNVHMPSHIYIRVGRWQDAIATNEKAIAAARQLHAVTGPPHGLIVFYNAHNHQMLTWAAMMTGQRDLALRHVRAMIDEIPEADLKENATFVEGMAAMPIEVMVRFGRWDDVLAVPDFPEWMPLSRALRLGARGIALAAKGDPKAARAEQAAYLDAAGKVPPEEMLLNNPAPGIVAVMTPMLEGEILVREGKVEEGVAKLREAAAAEDALHYDEPPDWIVPVRHSLGATLMKEKRYAEAEQVYRDDLARLPENGWSLYGLAQSLRRAGKRDAAEAVAARFRKTWANADMAINSSCLCQPGDEMAMK